MATNLLISQNLNLTKTSHSFIIFTSTPPKCQLTLPCDKIDLRVSTYIY